MEHRGLPVVVLAAILSGGCGAAIYARPRMDPMRFPEPPRDAITFWGHACAYIDVGGFGIVTDPVFTRSYALIRRRIIPAPPPASYDQARLVLLSHAHQDHLSRKTLAGFAPGTTVLCPAPSAKHLSGMNLRVRVVRPGDEVRFPGGTILAVAARHPGGRLSRKARSDGRAVGYVIRTATTTIYYSGDTEYFPGIAAIGARYRPEVALLNLNVHLHSHDALLAIVDLGMPTVVPIHLGAYDGTSARAGPRWRAELVEALGSTVVPLEVGESLPLPLPAGDDSRAR
jgi:L-ascorbate metabolism protein UlaG (beta-lactamase superfamily)